MPYFKDGNASLHARTQEDLERERQRAEAEIASADRAHDELNRTRQQLSTDGSGTAVGLADSDGCRRCPARAE